MKKIYIALLALGVFCAKTVSAEYYVSGAAGMSVNGGSAVTRGVKSNFKDGGTYSLAAGYVLPLPLLDVWVEGELMHLRADVKNGKDRTLNGAFANAYGVIPLIPLVDPYVGLGVGYTRYDHNNSLAVQGILGVQYSFMALPVAVGAEYRYLKLNEDGGKSHSRSNFHSNMLMLKLKYLF